jgi:hypothetical protein
MAIAPLSVPQYMETLDKLVNVLVMLHKVEVYVILVDHRLLRVIQLYVTQSVALQENNVVVVSALHSVSLRINVILMACVTQVLSLVRIPLNQTTHHVTMEINALKLIFVKMASVLELMQRTTHHVTMKVNALKLITVKMAPVLEIFLLSVVLSTNVILWESVTQQQEFVPTSLNRTTHHVTMEIHALKLIPVEVASVLEILYRTTHHVTMEILALNLIPVEMAYVSLGMIYRTT